MEPVQANDRKVLQEGSWVLPGCGLLFLGLALMSACIVIWGLIYGPPPSGSSSDDAGTFICNTFSALLFAVLFLSFPIRQTVTLDKTAGTGSVDVRRVFFSRHTDFALHDVTAVTLTTDNYRSYAQLVLADQSFVKVRSRWRTWTFKTGAPAKLQQEAADLAAWLGVPLHAPLQQ
jgi:hypothetical protein